MKKRFRVKIEFILTLLFINTVFVSFSQQMHSLKGYITDEDDAPFPHVNIFLLNSKAGTITNNDGAFSLHFSGMEDILNASFIGYETRTMEVDKNTGFVRIQLKPSPIQLNEVVISNLSAADLLKKAIGQIPENYPLEPFLCKAYYRAKLWEKDTLRYMEETMFDIVKSYRSSFSDEYFLIKNRNFRFASDHGALKQIGRFDIVKMIDKMFDGGFFRNYMVSYKPGTTFENRPVYVLSFTRKNNVKGNEGEIYIDAEDLAFVRFDIHYERGDTRFAQYRKVEGKYYLMNGNTLYLNKRLNRILPAEADIVITDIIPAFSKNDIKGIRIDTEDILEVYATQAQDTLFWQQHNAILPDSAISMALERYKAKQKDSIAIKNSEQYAAYIKRLYTPNLSFIISSGLEKDFSSFNHNSNSVNRYVAHLLQKNLHGILRQQLGIYLYQSLLSIPLEEAMSERLLLHKNGILAKAYPSLINRYATPYLYNIDNAGLSDFKNNNYIDFMRFHTVRNEGHHVKSIMLEEELAKIDLSNKNNLIDYLLLYAIELLGHREANIYNPFKKEVKQVDKPEEQQPLIIDRDRGWAKYLFDPDAEYQLHVQNNNLTDEEQDYLKRSAGWSWINLVSPQMYGIPKFKLNEKNRFTFSLNYLRTPFGELFGQNIWVMHNYSQLHGLFIKQYRNFEKTSFGIGYKQYERQLFRNMYVTTSLDAWRQPTDFRFKANSSFAGFHIEQMFEYQFMPDKYIERNNLSLLLGYDYKTKGYMPESFFLNENFSIKVGFKVNLR